MKKTVVIGGSGHIGTYLIPMLINAGHHVINITRGQRKPYIEDPAWQKVEHVILDRDNEPKFAEKVSSLNPDIVIDLINFKLQDTVDIVSSLQKTQIQHYLFCSSIWAHGRATTLPLDPNDPNKQPIDEYGKNKFLSEQYLKQQYTQHGFPVTIIMPGQICGPGWDIISPYGNIDHLVYQKVANGEKIFLPNLGMETLHHVHAEDVATMFFLSITHREASLGESFHAVSNGCITLFGYANLLFNFFNKDPKIEFTNWDEWKLKHAGGEKNAELSYLHFARSGFFSIENAVKKLDYKPKYTVEETIKICMKSYIERGLINVKND